MTSLTEADIQQMRDQVFFEGAERNRPTGDQVLVNATGPGPAPDLAVLRQDLDAAGLAGLDVRVSLVTVSYQSLPKQRTRGPRQSQDLAGELIELAGQASPLHGALRDATRNSC